MKYTALKNFMAFKLKDAIDKIVELAPEIAIHTALLITYPNDSSKFHWIDELITWLTKLQRVNDVKTPSGKLSTSRVASLLSNTYLEDLEDVGNTLKLSLAHYDKNLVPNQIDLSNYNLENYLISLDAIYDDYVKYIDKSMSLGELKDRMNKYYLYE